MHTTRHPVPADVLTSLFKDIYKFETVPVNNDVTMLGTAFNYLFSRQPNHARRFLRADGEYAFVLDRGFGVEMEVADFLDWLHEWNRGRPEPEMMPPPPPQQNATPPAKQSGMPSFSHL